MFRIKICVKKRIFVINKGAVMKIVLPQIEVLDDLDGNKILKRLELFGRVCYKSEGKINEDSSRIFISNILKSGHESVIEHEKISVRIICDRGVTHEIVRHRIASYSQESTRYCNYSHDKFGSEITVIKPVFWEENTKEYQTWCEMMKQIETSYNLLIQSGATPQEARSVLPNSLKTEIVVTMNLREWRHFLKLRTSPKAHPQMREIAYMILTEFKSNIPIIFDDIVC